MSTVTNHAGNDYAKRLAQQSRTPREFLVEPKVYFHRHNYAKFHFDFGIPGHSKTVAFANYRYITDDKREQDQLDLVADHPGTMVYTLPDSEVNAALENELQQEMVKEVQKTARAQAAVAGQTFDPNAPIVPVNTPVQTQHKQPTPVVVTPVTPQMAPQGVAVVGTQNSFSGTQAVDVLEGRVVEQTKSPDAASEAIARLAAMTAATKQS